MDERHATAHTPDGEFRAYYYSGPFKGVLAVKANMTMGKLNGTVTFWDDHGKLIMQQVFQDDMLIESRHKAPWLDNEIDQSLPDGVYTFASRPASGYSNWHIVENQEIYSGGKKVKTIPTDAEWQPIEEGFWKCLTGRLVCVPTHSGYEWSLNRRKVIDGTRLIIQLEATPVVFHLEEGVSDEGSPQFTDAQGRYLALGTYGAIYSWPGSDK